MFKQLKWDAIDIWKRYGWTLMLIPLTFLILFLTSNRNTTLNHVLIIAVTIISGIAVLFFFLLGNLVSTNWLTKPDTQLHLSIPMAPWKMIASKLILAVFVNALTCLFALQVMLMSAKFSIGSFRAMNLNDFSGIPEIIFLMSLINMTGIFCNALVRTIPWAQSHRIVFTLLFGFVVLFLLVFLALFAYGPLWFEFLFVLFVLEFFGSILLMSRFAHMD